MIPTNRNRLPVGAGKAAGNLSNLCCFQNTTASSADAIAKAYELKPRSKISWQGHCPACGYADAFSLSVSEDKLLWHCHACSDGQAIQHCLKTAGLLGGAKPAFTPLRAILKRPTVDKIEDKNQLAYIRQLCMSSQSLSGTVGERYLEGRGLKGPYPENIRFLPANKHTPTGEFFPSILGIIRKWPSSEIVAVHRTFLKPDGSGKIDHPQARMMLGNAQGAAVQLGEVSKLVAISEGLETALSVQQVSGIPTWACLSTSGLQSIILPDTVQEVLICADHDPPGLKAANSAAERLTRQGKLVKIARPPQSGTDFNDMLKGASHD